MLWELAWRSSERHASPLWQQTMSCLGLQSMSPNFDAAWVRAVQRRLLADGDLPSDVIGKRPEWWQLGMDVDKKPLEHEELEAATPCAAEEFSGEVFFYCRLCEDEGAKMPDLEKLVLGFRRRQSCTETLEHGAFCPYG